MIAEAIFMRSRGGGGGGGAAVVQRRKSRLARTSIGLGGEQRGPGGIKTLVELR